MSPTHPTFRIYITSSAYQSVPTGGTSTCMQNKTICNTLSHKIRSHILLYPNEVTIVLTIFRFVPPISIESSYSLLKWVMCWEQSYSTCSTYSFPLHFEDIKSIKLSCLSLVLVTGSHSLKKQYYFLLKTCFPRQKSPKFFSQIYIYLLNNLPPQPLYIIFP